MTSLPQIRPASDRWFAGGVRFRCLGTECGDCCSGKHGPGVVWLGRDEIERLARHLSIPVRELRRRYLRRLAGRTSLRERANFDCVFYRPGEGCSVYEARPLQCRTYPFWERIMASPATWKDETEKCPGIDAGDGSRPGGEPGTRVSGEEVGRQLAIDAARFRAGGA